MFRPSRSTIAAVLAALVCMPAAVLAHGVVGERFFPATLAIDDPFVADELSFPTVSLTKLHAGAGAPPTLQTDFSAELSKRLSPDLGISLGAAVALDAPRGKPTIAGFDNMAIGLKYVFLEECPARAHRSRRGRHRRRRDRPATGRRRAVLDLHAQPVLRGGSRRPAR